MIPCWSDIVYVDVAITPPLLYFIPDMQSAVVVMPVWCHSPDIHSLYLNQALSLHSPQGYRSMWESLLSDCQTCYVPLIAASQTLGDMQHCMQLKHRLLARGYFG